MRIKNGCVFGADHKMQRMDLCFENGVITHDSTSGEYDASGCYVLPGYIDTHIHGANGVEFCISDQDVKPALDWLSSKGVTSVLVSFATQTNEEYIRDSQKIANLHDERIVGIHAEGPFINPVRGGGLLHNRIQKPNIKTVQLIQKHSGNMLKILSMSPELDGAQEVIEYCRQNGVAVSMAHSDATFELATEAIDRGVTRATHTYNAMRPFNHRQTGVLGCALTDDRVTCEMICDLRHVSAPAIKLAVKAKGVDRITMISDSSFFAGLPEGEYDYCGQVCFVEDGVCKLPDGTIRGSALCLADGAKNMFDLGYSPEEIAIMACVNPAKACHCTDRGELDIGKRADIIILDQDFIVKTVFLAGQMLCKNK